MKKLMLLLFVISLFPLVSNKATGAATSKKGGESLFNRHCSACHSDAGRLKSKKNIIGKMRNPMSSMPQFDENKISNENAKKIDDYIHQEFDRVADESKNNILMRK